MIPVIAYTAWHIYQAAIQYAAVKGNAELQFYVNLWFFIFLVTPIVIGFIP